MIRLDDARNILRPNRAVRRADHIHLQPAELLQRRLYGFRVFAKNRRVIALHLRNIAFDVHRRIEHVAVQSAEAAERIAREEHLLLHAIRHHRLRPMQHRDEMEAQRRVAKRKF